MIFLVARKKTKITLLIIVSCFLFSAQHAQSVTAPVVTLHPISSPTNNWRQPVTGIATDAASIISSVGYQVNTTGGNWSACVADDGAFDELAENFTCTPSSDLSQGPNTLYVQAINDLVYPTEASVIFTVDTLKPSLTETTAVVTPTTDTTPSYIFTSTEAGAISYGGGCSAKTTVAAATANPITFNALASGTYANCTITVTDDAGNASLPLAVSAFTVDGPPVISGITADVSSDSASIAWNTDEDASSWVEYGTTDAYGTSTQEKDNVYRVAAHGVSLTGLESCTTYHYRVLSKDSLAQQAASADQTFKTSGCSDACEDGEPDKPDLNTAEAEDASSITIFYDDSEEDVNHYELRYGRTAGSYEWEVDDIGGKNEEEYTINELSSGTTYYFKIRAVNDCGESSWTGEVSAKTETASVAAPEVAPADEPVPAVQDTDAVATESPDLEGQLEDPADFESAKESEVAPSDSYAVSSLEMIGSGTGKKMKLEGKGPPNTTLTVYIYSSPIVMTVKTDNEGNWSYVLDKELEDGEHEIYVAVTSSDGKIVSKSSPVPFVKTAESVTIIPPAEAAAASQAVAPAEKRQLKDFLAVIVIGIVALLVAVLFVGYMLSHGGKKNTEQASV